MITWGSKKQFVKARTNTEAELRAITHVICEGIWLQRILKEFRITLNLIMTILCDNKAVISTAKNFVQHD